MSDNTIIQQGVFTTASSTVPTIITLRSDVDWMETRNWTQTAAAVVARTYWQRGLAAGTGFAVQGDTGANSIIAAPYGYTLIDTSTGGIGAAVATQAGTDVTQPVVSCNATTGLVTGMTGVVVRLTHAAWPNLSGLDIAVTPITNTSLTLVATLATAPGVVGGAGTYRIISYGPLYQPTKRVIANITAAANPTVTTLSYHGLVAGQQIRLVVPSVCGMTQAHAMAANIVSVTNTTSFVIDLDTSAFTAFTFPTAAQAPCTYAEVVPFGETATSTYVNLLNDAPINTGYIGMILGATAAGPCGVANDVIYWRAGKSF